MKKSLISITSIILIICLFASCGRDKIIDAVSTAETVLINGEAVDTVDEAIKLAEKSVGTDYKVVLMPQGSLTVPLLKKD